MHAGANDASDLERRCQHDEIGPQAWGNLSTVGQTEHVGRCGREHRGGRRQFNANDLDEVPQCHILCESAPRQRSPIAQAGNATGDDHIHLAEPMVAVAIVSRSDCVGDQRDAAWTGDADGHFQHRWRDMFKIGDQLDRYALIEQQRRDGTWLPVMQRWHRIKEVGCNTRADIDGLLDDRHVRTGVPNRHDCSRSDDLRDCRESAINLGRQRHHRDLAAGKQLDQLIVGNPAQNGGVMGSRVLRSQPWSLEVNAVQRAIGDEWQ